MWRADLIGGEPELPASESSPEPEKSETLPSPETSEEHQPPAHQMYNTSPSGDTERNLKVRPERLQDHGSVRAPRLKMTLQVPDELGLRPDRGV